MLVHFDDYLELYINPGKRYLICLWVPMSGFRSFADEYHEIVNGGQWNFTTNLDIYLVYMVRGT